MDQFISSISGPLLLFASFPSLIDNFWLWVAGAVLLGFGTALVYPTLLAAIGDVVHPGWRASAVGVYRLWRDLGYAVGALLSGIVADRFGLVWAVLVCRGVNFWIGGDRCSANEGNRRRDGRLKQNR